MGETETESETMKQPLPTGQQLVRESLEWFKLKYAKCVQICCLLAACNLFLLIFLGIAVLVRPQPVYYAVTPDLQIMQMVALDQPIIRNEGVSNWAAQTVISTLSLNFRTWKDQLSAVRSLYDPEAFSSLVVSMDKNNILALIKDKRLVCSAVIQDAPVILASGVQEGVYMWKLQMPVLLSFESSKGVEYRQRLVATMLVQRAPTSEYPQGVNVRQIVFAQES